MSDSNDNGPRDYRKGVETLRRVTESGLDEQGLARVRANLLRGGLRHTPRTLVGWSWRLGAAAAAVAAVLAVSQLVLDTSPATPMLARVVMRGGSIQATIAEQASTAFLDGAAADRVAVQLQESARIGMTLGTRGRAVFEGPARFAVEPDQPLRLNHGRAAFSVAKHNGAPFSIRAGSDTITVLGTQFGVVVQDGQLAWVSVAHGSVRVEHQGEAHLLTDGQSYAPIDGTGDEGEQVVPYQGLDASWWQLSKPDGRNLRLTSEPSGAAVLMDGEYAGETPLMIPLPTRATIDLELTKDGFEPWLETISPSNQSISMRAALESIEAISAPAEVGPKRTIEELWRLAEAGLVAKRCREVDKWAQRILRRLSTKHERARATLLMAECNLRGGSKSRALTLYRRVSKDAGTGTAGEIATFEAAKLAARMGKRREARRLLANYRRTYPQGQFIVAASFRLCEMEVLTGRLSTAERCLQRFEAEHHDAEFQPGVALLQADLARNKGRFSEAAALYTQFLANPRQGRGVERAMYHRATALQQGHLRGLAAAISAYLERFPQGQYADELRGWASQ